MKKIVTNNELTLRKQKVSQLDFSKGISIERLEERYEMSNVGKNDDDPFFIDEPYMV